MRKAFVAVVVVAGVLAGLFYLLRTPEGPIVLARRYKVGEKSTYRAKWKVKMDSYYQPGRRPAQIARVDVTRKVLKVNKDGSALIAVSCKGGGANFCLCAYHFPYWHGKRTISKEGRIVEPKRWVRVYSDDQVDADCLPALVSELVAVLPSHGVAVGQSWNETIPFPMGGGDLTLTGALISDRVKLGKRRVCKIENRYEGTIDIGKIRRDPRSRGGRSPGVSGKIEISGRCTLYFSRREGRIVRQDEKVRIVSTQTIGKTPGIGGSSTGASITYEMTGEAEAKTVLVEKRGKGGRSKVSPSP